MKKFLCVLLSLILLLSGLAVVGYAEEEETFTAKFLNCNVAGLPDFAALIGKGSKDVEKNEQELGAIFNASDYDVIAVQEDFNYHDSLIGQMTNYNYATNTSGGVPGGDGLNVYTKNSPIYDETRIEWETSYGGISEGDSLTPKGILYTVIDFGNGVTVDFYDLHADAFDGVGNSLSRAAQYIQLMNVINEKSAGRPVIITGDFNTSIHLKGSGEDGTDEEMLYKMVKDYGFKDAWIELYNNGNYDDFSACYDKYSGDYWGIWDSVEKFYYRSGSGIEITAESFEYLETVNASSERISDHNGAVCNFKFTKTDSFAADAREHTVVAENKLSTFFSTIKWIIKDLVFVLFDHFDELLSLAGLNK